MNNLKLSAAMSVLLGVMSSVPALSAQSTPPPTNSAPGSQTSDTRATSAAERVSSPTVREGALTDGGTASRGLGGTTSEKQSFSARQGGKPQELTRACSGAVAELEASRRLIDLLERENSLLKDRLETETRTVAILTELNASRKAEGEALRTAIAAKTETLAAKDEVIASQQKLIDSLKQRKSSPWKRLGDVLIGVAAGALIL